jgi:hypothetical protein
MKSFSGVMILTRAGEPAGHARSVFIRRDK